MGRVCEKHQQWCPTGECRWCPAVAYPIMHPQMVSGVLTPVHTFLYNGQINGHFGTVTTAGWIELTTCLNWTPVE